MEMTLGQILGSVMARMTKRSAMPELMLIEQINGAGDEIIIAMRSAWSEKALTTSTVDLVADTDIYSWPADVDEVRKMDRLDLGDEPVPVNRRALMRDDIETSTFFFQEGYTYVILPDDQFRLVEAPTDALTAGLRIRHYPKFVPLTALDDVPNLPERIHECLVAKALTRIMGLEDVQIVNLKATVAFIAGWEQRLIDFLYPPDAERGPEVDEEFGYYQEQF